MSDSDNTAEVSAIEGELHHLRKRALPLGAEALLECPTITEIVGAGDPADAAANLVGLLRISVEQAAHENAVAVKVATSVLLSHEPDVLGSLVEAGGDFHMDQRTARRHCDRGFKLLAQVIAIGGRSYRPVCVMSLIVDGQQSADALRIRIKCSYPHELPFSTFQVLSRSGRPSDDARRIDPFLSFRTEGDDQFHAVSAVIEMTKTPGRALDLGFSPAMRYPILASVTAIQLTPDIVVSADYGGAKAYVVRLQIAIDDAPGPQSQPPPAAD